MAHAIDNARFIGELRQVMADYQNKLTGLRCQLQEKRRESEEKQIKPLLRLCLRSARKARKARMLSPDRKWNKALIVRVLQMVRIPEGYLRSARNK